MVDITNKQLIKIMKRVHDNKLIDMDSDINTYSDNTTPKVEVINEDPQPEDISNTKIVNDEDINTYTANQNYKDEHLTKIITQALNIINKKSIDSMDLEDKTFIDDIPYVNNIIPSNSYKWKECAKQKDFKESNVITSITDKCKSIIKKKIDSYNWNIVTILNNKECIVYNNKTKENQIIDIDTGEIHKDQFINTIVKSVLAKK
tara:strand:+ start:3325 stop:3936 length:612 start_codon:yes stop_codon:yes gene_type:complete